MRLARLLGLALWLSAAACSGLAPEQAAEAPAPPTLSPVEQGRALFRNKGCVTCHQHDAVPGETGLLAVGPNLTPYSNDPAFLRQWLADPKALRPETPMPDIELSATEIEYLIAFLNE